MTEPAKHWIGGKWVGSGSVSDSINPATGEVLGQWDDGGEAEAASTIAAANEALVSSDWTRDRGLRSEALTELAERFDADAEELGTLVTKENGKKIAEGLFEGGSPSPTLRHNAAMALTNTGIAAEVAPGQWYSTYAEPAGVVGYICSVELPGCPFDPFSWPRPRCRKYCRCEDARTDSVGCKSGVTDHCRVRIVA